MAEELSANLGTDIEMTEGGATEGNSAAAGSELPYAGEETVVETEAEPARIPFIDYLSSPIVTLIVGSGDKETILTAHQALLALSPYFKDQFENFSDDGSVSIWCDHICAGPAWLTALCGLLPAPPARASPRRH
jgi:hypothetical protein